MILELCLCESFLVPVVFPFKERKKERMLSATKSGRDNSVVKTRLVYDNHGKYGSQKGLGRNLLWLKTWTISFPNGRHVDDSTVGTI